MPVLKRSEADAKRNARRQVAGIKAYDRDLLSMESRQKADEAVKTYTQAPPL